MAGQWSILRHCCGGKCVGSGSAGEGRCSVAAGVAVAGSSSSGAGGATRFGFGFGAVAAGAAGSQVGQVGEAAEGDGQVVVSFEPPAGAAVAADGVLFAEGDEEGGAVDAA